MTATIVSISMSSVPTSSDLFHDHPLGSSDQSRDHRPFEFCGLLLLGHLIEW
ncbi:hypothetical protein CRG98_002828 [Punica granatum]|uniref:Uncharacterized protein n=1 Tax=Punica granatum TaxID=22663 RepID=A0A2I0L808_PUNGR|nr:hypothetical protein CRG98_002828 [Punica granatum]